MYFADLLVDQSARPEYEALLTEWSELVKEAVCLLAKAGDVSQAASFSERKLHHVTVHALTWHIIESLDGVSVLTAAGCAEPSKPLLRSSFEAMLGIQYVLEADEERRGLAYQVAHAHRRLALYKRLDPNEETGKELAKSLANDPLATGVTQNLPAKFDLQKMIANLEGMFRKPEFAPIEAEWSKGKNSQHWFSLFGGPKDVCRLASHLKWTGMYEFLYRHWSNNVHAGDCLEDFGPGDNGTVSIRPLRHPEGLQSLVSMAVSISLAVGRTLLARYGTEQQREQFRDHYIANLQQRNMALRQGEVINAPWRKGNE
jgi:hypothetical protein